jgi:hypothetical protein
MLLNSFPPIGYGQLFEASGDADRHKIRSHGWEQCCTSDHDKHSDASNPSWRNLHESRSSGLSGVGIAQLFSFGKKKRCFMVSCREPSELFFIELIESFHHQCVAVKTLTNNSNMENHTYNYLKRDQLIIIFP